MSFLIRQAYSGGKAWLCTMIFLNQVSAPVNGPFKTAAVEIWDRKRSLPSFLESLFLTSDPSSSLVPCLAFLGAIRVILCGAAYVGSRWQISFSTSLNLIYIMGKVFSRHCTHVKAFRSRTRLGFDIQCYRKRQASVLEFLVLLSSRVEPTFRKRCQVLPLDTY